jgi:hypothetical protein
LETTTIMADSMTMPDGDWKLFGFSSARSSLSNPEKCAYNNAYDKPVEAVLHDGADSFPCDFLWWLA